MQNFKGGSFFLCLLLACLAGPASGQDSVLDQLMEGEYLPGGARACLGCHSDASTRAIVQTPHAFMAAADSSSQAEHRHCQTCHGPSARHVRGDGTGQRPRPPLAFDEEGSAENKNAVCETCHQTDMGGHWAGSVHQFEAVACTDCHSIHSGRDPVTQEEDQARVCFDCHREQRADFLRPSAHPVDDRGLQTCMDCHEPHGGAGPSMLAQPTLNQACYKCHAEKRGPFLWEHAPVREDCTNCHVPHGSNHEPLLQARTPWLCQQCHLAQYHPSTALSGTGAPPRGASQLLLNKDCMNCHSDIHGSNHPSGPGLIR